VIAARQKSKSTFRSNMKYPILALALLFGCGPSNTDTPTEKPIGILEEFEDTPGLIRTEIVDAAGRLSTIGYYRNGKKEGTWTEYTEDERVHRITTYMDGKKEGLYMEFGTRNEINVRCYFHNDQRHGKYVEYAVAGIKEDRFYENGKMEGIARKFFNDGKLMEVGYFKGGLRDGISTWYDRDGNKTLEYEYRKGELVKK